MNAEEQASRLPICEWQEVETPKVFGNKHILHRLWASMLTLIYLLRDGENGQVD
ncbi:hypothetical protein HMPREF1705_04728 [Acetomicrobium hydrogeniformans ATCC BAA-1850]|uniref:Uncharacterized protein n=1 Tax=Acetomicrobium hydrogeniformans ATCC BAA-1850 TaxID=592015 RepID=A0A0T5XDP7_9BACT|nr:hypothetical protein HMPREF1705_04728 [Acetomicrobium hydrogeniformans ATCC BAA-1850]